MEWLDERTTHHTKDGKFCSPGSASTVTKDGERYKVVRQHRRMKPSGASKVKDHRKVTTVAESSARAHAKAAALRAWASMRGPVPVHEVLSRALQ